MSLRRRLMSKLQSVISSDGGDPLPLRLVFWDGDTFDFAPAPAVTLTLHSPALMRALFTGRFDKLGDAYVSGGLTVDGRIEDILRIGIDLAERIGRAPQVVRLAKPLKLLSFRHSKRNDAKAIAHHYDVSNEFYRLWLDESMTYSCAYFRTGAEDIDTAQAQKIDHICRKLRLQPGDHVLDIGCGWGGLLCAAGRRYGIAGVGIANSAAQHQLARERVEALGLSDRIDIRLQDYRELSGDALFDKVVSVGMYEHVGLANLPDYVATIVRLLKPGGALLNHGIITTDAEGRPQGPPGGEFINRYVFPGGELPNLPRALTEFMRGGLEPADVEDLRPHYARTLLLWVRRLEARRDAVIAAGGPERYRIWRVYLAGMAHAFDRRWLSVVQVLAYKPRHNRPAPRPWTREYQYRAGEPCSTAGAMDWNSLDRRILRSSNLARWGNFIPVAE
jgi:cyclopropane-fatty-acyl-phospholipid synthase